MYPIVDIARSLPIARPGKDFPLERFEALIVHKTDADGSTPRGTAEFHIGPERKWSHIAYHFYLDKAAVLYQTLPLSWIGIHAPPNYTRCGLVLVGKCSDPMTPAQSAALPDVLSTILSLMNQGRVKPSLTLAQVQGHLEVMPGHTDCPGDDVLKALASLRHPQT